MTTKKNTPSIILISGPDGSGKSTICRIIMTNLSNKGYPVKYSWLRYPRLFSVFPLLLARILGITRTIKIPGICTRRYHLFEKLPILGKLYAFLILLDYILYKLVKVTIPRSIGYIVIVDRNIMDIAVDIYAELGSLPSLILRCLGYESRKISKKLLVMASLCNLLRRRSENRCNPKLRQSIGAYNKLANLYNFTVHYNDSKRDLILIAKEINSEFVPIRVYSDPKISLIRALFYRHKWAIYLSNFLFQTMGYMWSTELIFRLALQGLLFCALLSANVNIIISLLLTHILMYPLYSNVYAISKWIDNKYSDKKYISIINQLLLKLSRTSDKFKNCMDIILVGSVARRPQVFLEKKADVDVRIVPKRMTLRCILVSLLLAIYLRVWGIVHKAPIDLYVKSPRDPEIVSGDKVTVDQVLNALKRGILASEEGSYESASSLR